MRYRALQDLLMFRQLRNASFTLRLVAISFGVIAVLIVVDYIALLEVPGRVARDTVEIALRENVQALNSTFREDQARLTDRLSPIVYSQTDRSFRRALLTRDTAVVKQRLADLDPEIQFTIRDFGDTTPAVGTGPITYQVRLTSRTNAIQVVFYLPVTDDVMQRASDAAGNEAPFALEHDGHFVATSASFPTDIRPEEVGGVSDPSAARLQDIDVGGRVLHAYSRALSSDPSYQLHALSTKQLEEAALAEIRSDVKSAIGSMTLATIAAFIMLIFFTNRTVGSFARRVRTLADGDYGTRMRVLGRDGFADLAESVNRLSRQLDHQLGQLEATAQAFERTLETLDEGICVWSESGTVTYWNRGAEQLTGVPRERAGATDPVVSFLREERAPGMRRVTLPIRHGGLVVDLVVTAMPDGGVVQTFRDTTMADLLQQTQRNFMATAAHELRTPITAILGFSDTLVNPELELTDRQRQEFIAIVHDHASQLERIADAFFTNHQLANERVEVSITPTVLGTVVNDAIRRVGSTNPGSADELSGLDVRIDRSIRVLADRRALVGVVSVLVENAVKYGEPPLEITADRQGGTVTITVSDHGDGIEAHHHPRLFDPFYRVDVDMRSGVGGAGLGLFTARKLVEAMHGTIRVVSIPGRGATFVVELPVAPGDVVRSDDDGTGDGALRLVAG